MDSLPAVESIRKAYGVKIRIPGGPYIGKLVGLVAYFPVERSRHFFRLWQSWTLDARLVAALRGRAGAIIFDDTETGEAWTVSLESFTANGRPIRNRTGVKLALPERFWRPARGPQSDPALRPRPGAAPGSSGMSAAQSDYFEVLGYKLRGRRLALLVLHKLSGQTLEISSRWIRSLVLELLALAPLEWWAAAFPPERRGRPFNVVRAWGALLHQAAAAGPHRPSMENHDEA